MLYTVSDGQRRGRRRPERGQRPPPVRDTVRAQPFAVPAEDDEGQVTGPSRVRPEPARQFDLAGVDGLHVGQRAALASPAPARAAEQVGLDAVQPRGQRGVLGVGDHPGHPAEPRLGGRADGLAAPHPDADQPADDGVDAALRRLVRVGTSPAEEEHLGRPAVGLLVEEQPHGHAGVGLDALQPGQPRQVPRGLAGKLPGPVQDARRRPVGGAGGARPDADRELEAVARRPARQPGGGGLLVPGDGRDDLRRPVLARAPRRAPRRSRVLNGRHRRPFTASRSSCRAAARFSNRPPPR